MAQTNSRVIILLTALVAGLGLLVGCAAQPTGSPVERTEQILADAEGAFQEGRYQQAEELYLQVSQHPELLSKDQMQDVETRLGRIRSILQEEELQEEAIAEAPAEEKEQVVEPEAETHVEEEQTAEASVEQVEVAPEEAARMAREQAPALLKQVESAIEEGDFQAAVQPVQTLEGLREHLDEEMRIRYDIARQAVQEHVEALPELSKSTKRNRAQAYFDEGRELYKEGDYKGAHTRLELAEGYDVSIGWWDNRSLRNTLEKVRSELSSLEEAVQQGTAAYEEADYEAARDALKRALESPVELEPDRLQAIEKMLADIDRKIADQMAAEAAREEEEAEAAEERAERLVAEAEAILNVQEKVDKKLQQANQAKQAGDYGQAEKLYGEALRSLQETEFSDAPALSQLRQRAEQELAEVRQMQAEKERMAALQRELAQEVKQAQELAGEDLMAAERKVAEAKEFAQEHGLALAADQQDALANVEDAVQEKYGAKREASRQVVAWAETAVDQYAAAGGFQKAAQLAAMLAQSESPMVSASLKQSAATIRQESRARVEQQMQTAQDLAARLGDVVQVLKENGVQHALDQLAGVEQQFNQAGLTVDAAEQTFLERYVELLNADVLPAIQAELKTVDQSAPELLADALAAVEGLSYEAPEVDDTRETQAMLELARRLKDLAREGEREEAAQVRQQINDLKVRVAAKRAAKALAEGDLDAARQQLAAAPTGAASEKVQESVYEPLAAKVRNAEQAHQALEGARQALANAEVQKAAQAIQGVPNAELPRPLQLRADALAGVLDQLRQTRARLTGIAEQIKQKVQSAKTRLDELQERLTAWSAYVKALGTALAPDAAREQVMEAVTAALKQTEGLLPAELESLRGVSEAYAEANREALETARTLLDRARSQVSQGNYAGASETLSQLKQSAGYGLDPQLSKQTKALQQQIRAAETAAQRLYEQAVEAYRAGNAEKVAQIMRELRAKYQQTEAYQSRQ